MGNIFKKRSKKYKQIVFAVVGTTFLVITTTGLFSPKLLEWIAEKKAMDFGFSEVRLQVRKLNPWASQWANLSLTNEQSVHEVKNIDFSYNPQTLVKGKLKALGITGMKTEIRQMGIMENLKTSNRIDPSVFQKLSPHEFVEDLLKNPPVTFLRIRDSIIEVEWKDYRFILEFLAKFDFREEFLTGNLDGKLLGVEVFSEWSSWNEEENFFLTGEFTIPKLFQINEVINLFSKYSEQEKEYFPIFKSGNAVFETSAKLSKRNTLDDVFVEMNASKLSFVLRDMEIQAENLILFITPKNEKIVDFNLFANLQVGDFLTLEGANARLRLEDEQVEFSCSVAVLQTLSDLPSAKVVGLTLPFLNLQRGKAFELPIGDKKSIHFDEISLNEEGLKLYEGSVEFQKHGKTDPIHIRVPSLDASLPSLNLTLVGFSYDGYMDTERTLSTKHAQVLSGERILFGDEAVIEDLSLSFATRGVGEIMVTSFSFIQGRIPFELQPAGILVRLDQNQTNQVDLDFNGTTLNAPDLGFSVSGIRGTIRFSDFNPLRTQGLQRISFDRMVIEDFELRNGKLSFEIQHGKELAIRNAQADFLGGRITIDFGIWDLTTGDVGLKVQAKSISGQDLLEKFEFAGENAKLAANFSGSMQFSNRNGTWDFGTGNLKLQPSGENILKMQIADLLTNGLEEGTDEFEKMELTAWALSDLTLNSMRVDFKVTEEERQIIISINGKRDTEKKKVDLRYRPKIIGGLKEILEWRTRRKG